MRNLIKADMQRILKKKSIWIAFIFMVAVVAGEIFYQVSKAPDRNFGFAVAAADGMSYVGLVLGTILVLNIYADDFKSTAYINVVGRGINRKKFIIAKFLDALIIIGGMYLCGGALIFGLQAGLGISLTSLEIRFLFLTFMNELIFTAASISIAALIFFITENNVLGILAFLSINMIIPVTIVFVRTNPTFAKYNIEKLYLDGAASSMFSDFMMGQVGAGLLKLFIILAVYVFAAIIASIIIFRKKELDF